MKCVIKITLAVMILLTAAQAQAQRMVTINGQLMGPQQLVILDRLAGGSIPDGYYWLNLQTGAWGYPGNPLPQGYLGGRDYSRSGVPEYHGHNYRGYFGDYLSDGHCSFVNGIAVGDCG